MMAIKLKIIIVMGICSLMHTYGFSQATSKRMVTISGKIVSGRNANQDSIHILLHQDCPTFGEQRKVIPINSHGEFKYEFPPVNKLAHIKMKLKGNSYVFINRIVEPGDSLFIAVVASDKRSKGQYSGNNTEKYTCEDSLKTLLDLYKTNLYNEKNKANYDLAVMTGDYQKIHELYLSGYMESIRVLDWFKGKLSPAVYAYFKGESTHFYQTLWELILKTEYLKTKNDTVKGSISQCYQLYKFPDYNHNQLNASFNEVYLFFLIEKIKTALFFKYDGKGYSYRELYSSLKRQSDLGLRDRMLVFFLTHPNSSVGVKDYESSDYSYCLADAQSLIKVQNLRKILTAKSVLKKGAAVYNFSLPDPDGKLVTLESLRGNVVLLDVWAEGCTGCALFSKLFTKDIYPNINNKQFFKIVSISVDRTKTGWMRGINSGLYTSKDHINLFTEGKALNHDFPKYYQINAIPFIILIDKKGRIFSKIDLSLPADEVVKLINDALEEPG